MFPNKRKIRVVLNVAGRVIRRYKWRFGLITGLGLLSGFSEAIGIGAVIPIFSILTEQDAGATNAIVVFIKNIFLTLHIPLTLPYLVLFVIALFILKAVIRFCALYINERTFTLYEQEVREDLFSKTLAASWPYLLNQNIGHLEKTLMRDMTLSTAIIRQLSEMILLLTGLATYAFVAFTISPELTLFTTILGVSLFFIFKPTVRKIRSFAKILEQTEKKIAHFVNESIVGIKILKTYVTENNVSARGAELFKRLRDNKLKVEMYKHVVGTAYEPIGLVFIAILFAYYYKTSGFEIGSFAAIMYLIHRMFAYAQTVQSDIQTFTEKVPYLEALFRYREDTISHNESRGGTKEFLFNRELCFEGVSFEYDSGREILSNVNFTIKKNTGIGLIGPSGAGKTTIVDLLMRFFKPSAGHITLDGVSIEEFDITKWRKMLAYVPQDVFLINDTISNNVRLYDDSITDEAIEQSTKEANIFNAIQQMPEGFDTVVGDRGVKLSAGQRQRIALARALVRKPDVLILDEATSALDTESENAIQATLEKLRGRITIFTIAHRLSTIMDSDKLIVLKEGKIAEEGKPDELLKKQDSHFYEIYNIKR